MADQWIDIEPQNEWVDVNPKFTKIAESPDMQRMAYLARTMPFYRRGASLMSGKSLEEIDRTLNAIPEPANNLGNALFKALPDIAMASPVMRGAGAIPKIWPVVKTALGLGAYGGARAAGQNQPILPAVAQSAAFGTLGHGLGRAATTIVPKIPFRGNIGSSIGWGATGAALSPEDRLQGAAFGAGMGVLSPSKPLQRPYFNEIAGRINNSLMKSPDLNKALLYGDPGKGIAREGLTGKNLESLKKNVELKLEELNQTADKSYTNNKTKIADYKSVFRPLIELRNKLMEHPLDNKAAIKRLNDILKDVSGVSTGQQKSFTNLDPLEARRLKQEVDTFTDWLAVGKGDHEINIALKKTYHNVDSILDTNVPQLKQLNDRIKDLISAKKAIDVNIRKGKSVDIIPENWWELANVPFRSVKSVVFKTNLARALAQRYPKTKSGFSLPLKNIPVSQQKGLPYGTKQLPFLGRAPYKPTGYPTGAPPQKPLITPYEGGGPVIQGQLPYQGTTLPAIVNPQPTTPRQPLDWKNLIKALKKKTQGQPLRGRHEVSPEQIIELPPRKNLLRDKSGQAFTGSGQEVSHPSRIYKVLTQSPQETWSPQQLRGFLSGKVSKNELDTLLTPELMAKPKIMKSDVLQSIEKNMPQVEVVRKYEKNTSAIKKLKNQAENQYRQTGDYRGLDYEIDRLEREFPQAKFGPDAHPTMSLPGGSNYQETLIKAPVIFSKGLPEGFKILKSPVADWYFVRSPYNENIVSHAKTPEIAKQEAIKYLQSVGESGVFKSSHFDEPNVLAHVRHNDRVTPQGEKVRFLEEIQSDWATQRRKHLELAAEEGLELSEDIMPSHPLLKNWQELTLKQAIKDAVEADAKYLSWTTGEQQAGRYNLAKQVDNISWRESPDGTKAIYIKPKDTPVITVYADKNGIIQRGGQDNWKGKNISETIGKGIGEKIVTTQHGELSGEGLNIGGEWAKNLYDKQIPNILKKLTGQDVEMIKIGGTKWRKINATQEPFEMIQPAIRLTPELKAQIKSGKGKIAELFNVGMLGPTAAAGIGLAAALKATSARAEGETLDPKYKQQIANAENYRKTTGDWAQLEDIALRDLKRIGKLKQNVTLEQVKRDPQLYEKVVKLYWDRLDDFGIPDKDKALWWLMPGRYRQTGGDISRLKNPEHRNIMRNRIKNIGGK